jgi:hypothetical protein
MGAMKTSKPSFRAGRTDGAQRARLLAEFERSGLSAVDFARQQGLNYTTFCGWRQRRDKTKTSPAFVQVEVTPVPVPTELLIEVGAAVRIRLHSEGQIALAARLLQHLNAARPC